jgi:hypothetical protein
VYPELFSVGHFPVATYGVVLALAVLAGGSLARGCRTAAEGVRASEGRRRDGWAHESGSRAHRLAAAGQGRVSERP